MQLVIKVHLYRSPYTICYISEDRIILPDEYSSKYIGFKVNTSDFNVGDEIEIKNDNMKELNNKSLKLSTSALFLQPFLKECLNSEVYRMMVLRNFNELSENPSSGTLFLKLILEPPDKEVIDYAWNYRISVLIWTRVEVENAFSWLSTLGGAYSALGDYFEHCAEEAGKISMRQYALSKMLGDESLAARSKLYSAIAYAQRGKLKLAKYLVKNIAIYARETNDKRLNRMCQGVWVKLKYLKDKAEKGNCVERVCSK